MGIEKTKTIVSYDPESGHLVGLPVITVNSILAFNPDNKPSRVKKIMRAIGRLGFDLLDYDYEVRLLTKTFMDYFRGMAENNIITLVCLYGNDTDKGFVPQVRLGCDLDVDDECDQAMFAGLTWLGQLSGMSTLFSIFGMIGGAPYIYGYYVSAESEVCMLPEEALDAQFDELIGVPDAEKYQPNRWDFGFSLERNTSEYLSQFPVDQNKVSRMMKLVSANVDAGMSLPDACRTAEDVVRGMEA